MKIVLKHGIIAAVVISALSGCQPEPDSYVRTFGSVEECTKGSSNSASECQAQWDKAKEENAKTGPRFEDSADCATEFGSCERYVVQNSDGTSSNVFIPMMMGMMMGNMMANNAPVPTQPLYRSETDKREGRSGFVSASGAYISKGKSGVYSGSVVSRAPTTISKGGFGSTGGKSGGGFSSGG